MRRNALILRTEKQHPIRYAASKHDGTVARCRQVAAPCYVACGSGMTYKHPAMWHVAVG